MGPKRVGSVKAAAMNIGVGLVTATLVASGITDHSEHRVHPRLSVAVDPVAAIVDSPTTVGIADSSLFFASDADIDKTFEELKSLGVQNIRIQIPWAGVEYAPDAFTWRLIDKQVDAAVAHGMGILGVINQSPDWIAGELAGHPDPAEFAEFAGDVARRYKGEISAYEIWNEPNSVQFFDPIDPAAYTELLKAAYPVIKEVDPSITVIGGVLGAVIGQGAVVLNPVRFAEQMFEAGASGYFDALSFHPYQYTLKFSEGDIQVASPKRQIEAIRALMRFWGSGDLPIWATEYGLPTTDGNVDQQAEFIDDFLRAWQDVEHAGPVFIYTTRDFAEGSTSDQDNFGIFYADWTAKPAAQVIADFIESLQPDHPIRDAIRAAVQALVQLTGDLIEFGVDVVVGIADAIVDVTRFVVDTTIDVVKFVVETTAEVIADVVRLGVGLVRTGVDIITGVVNRIVTAVTDCLASHGVSLGATTTAARSASVFASASEGQADADADADADAEKSARPDADATVESNVTPAVDPASAPVEDVDAVLDGEGEVTEPEAAEPETTEPETTEPEVAEPETTEPETTEPEVAEPETTEPEVPEPEGGPVQPDVIVADLEDDQSVKDEADDDTTVSGDRTPERTADRERASAPRPSSSRDIQNDSSNQKDSADNKSAS